MGLQHLVVYKDSANTLIVERLFSEHALIPNIRFSVNAFLSGNRQHDIMYMYIYIYIYNTYTCTYTYIYIYVRAGPCTECVASKYKSSTGSGSCTPCSIGTYSAKIQATAITSCTACPSSATSPEASTTVSYCTCATGHTMAGSDCVECQAGKYKPTTGQVPFGHLFCSFLISLVSMPMCFLSCHLLLHYNVSVLMTARVGLYLQAPVLA